MKKETLWILALMIGGIAMLIWTFFGGSNPENDISSAQWKQFIWWMFDNFSWWETSETSENTESLLDKVNINVMMPRYFYTKWWKDFAQDLYVNQKIYINFLFMDNLNNYKNLVSEPWFSGADLMLVPYDWVESLDIDSFAFSQSIAPAFDEMIKPIVKDAQISFLPFAADPMIMYSLSWIKLNETFYGLGDLIYDRAPPRLKSIPLFFGLVDADFYDEWFKREYQDIVRYALMHYFLSNNDVSSLETWLETNVLQNYSIDNLNTILEIIWNSVENCETYPSICFQLYKFVWVRFWFLSDWAIVKQYFNTKSAAFEELWKSKMPFVGLESPVRIRWRVIPSSLSDIKTINSVYLFLNQYINKSESYSLYNYTLPVLDNSNQLLWDNQFISQMWYILESWWNFIEQQKSQKAFQQLIGYQISANNYMKKL